MSCLLHLVLHPNFLISDELKSNIKNKLETKKTKTSNKINNKISKNNNKIFKNNVIIIIILY